MLDPSRKLPTVLGASVVKSPAVGPIEELQTSDPSCPGWLAGWLAAAAGRLGGQGASVVKSPAVGPIEELQTSSPGRLAPAGWLLAGS